MKYNSHKAIVPSDTSDRCGIDLDQNVLFTVPEVARLLKTNVDYVHKLRRSGLLPCIKLGQYKVRKEALSNFLKLYEGSDLTDPFNVKEMEYSGKDQHSGQE